MLIRAGEPPIALQRVRLGSAQHGGFEREAFIQNLVYDHPEIIPMAEIEPAFMPLISICRELPTTAGQLDNLWLTPNGGIILGECKLFRNPEARREVVAQALDYARSIANLRYSELEAAVKIALHSPSATLWGFVKDQSDLDEAQFADAIERRLRQSRFMVMIIGDGIQEGVESLANHLQLHAGLHVGLSLVDLSIWRDLEGRLLVLPRIPLRTLLIERGVVTIASTGLIEVQPPSRQATTPTNDQRNAFTVSEPEFYDQLEQRKPGLSGQLRVFVESLANLGVTADFERSLYLRRRTFEEKVISFGTLDNVGKAWFSKTWTECRRAGHQGAGDTYLSRLATISGGVVNRYQKGGCEVLMPGNKGIDLATLLACGSEWRDAIELLADTLDRGAG